MLNRNIALLVLAGVMILGSAMPATAGPAPRIDLRGASLGAYVLDDAGTAQIEGDVTGKPFDGPYTATLAAADGTLPEPGECEAGTATVQVTGPRGRYLRLEATGQVCGRWTDATYVVTHRFTGRYDVTDTNVGKIRGTDGWIGLLLATENRANVEIIDT